MARCFLVAVVFMSFISWSVLGAKPVLPDKKKAELSPASSFRPIDLNGELTENDANDPSTKGPAKRFVVQLPKDRTYVIEMISSDMDPFLLLLDRSGNPLAQDDDSAGDLNAQIIFAPEKDSEVHIIASVIRGDVGRFTLRVREFALRGEAEPRQIGMRGHEIHARINKSHKSELGKLGRMYSFEMKAGVTYSIDLFSRDFFSCMLNLFDSRSRLLAKHGDFDGGPSAPITFRPERDGVYHIFATSLSGSEIGEFTLKIRPDK